MVLTDILLGILSNIISDDVRRRLEERKYRKALEKRIEGLHDRVAHAYGEDGIAFLRQAADCVSEAEFTQEQIINQATLRPTNLFIQLAQKSCYKNAIDPMLPCERELFIDLCKRILGFICRELPRLDPAHREITAEILLKTDESGLKIDAMNSKIDVVQAELSRRSEAEQQRNEMEIKQLLTSIELNLLVYKFDNAYRDAQHLREWLGRRGEDQPRYIAADIYITLAEVETTRVKNALDQGAEVDLSSARSYLEKARSVDQGHLMDRINALDAFIVSVSQGPDAGLALLADRNDPYSTRRRLMILRNSERTGEAATIARGLTHNEMYCEQIAFVLAVENQKSASKRLLKWCKSLSNTIIRDRCLLGHAHGTYEHLMRKYVSTEIGSLFSVSDEDRGVLQEIVEIVRPIKQAASARGHIDTQLEAWAIGIALLSQLQLRNKNELEELADLLATRQPIPLVLAKLAIDQQIDMPSDCIKRLRSEHPNSFEAKLIAAAIERELLHQPEDAFNSAMDLISQAILPEQREKLCELLVEISQDLKDEARAEVSRVVPSLLIESDRFLRFLEIDSLLRQGLITDASALLDEIKDETDPLWLQMFANYLVQSGDNERALGFLLKAAEIKPYPDLLWRTAAMAHHLSRLNDAANLLRKYVTLRPRDIYGRANFAIICMDIGDFRSAAREFAELQERQPDNLSHAFNRAISLAALGDTDGASAVLDLALRDRDVPLQFLLQRADLAKASGQPQDALALLKEFRDRYWNQPEFVAEFMRLGYAAGDEFAAHEAFAQLRQLQLEGSVTPDILHEMSLDDLVEQIKQHREQANHIHQDMLVGRASWLMTEEYLGRVPYMGWWIRTQSADGIGDDSHYRAEHTIYSTNAFTMAKEEQEMQSLEPIDCPAMGTSVVADLSALITLHRLGLLGAAADYFGKIMIPAAYLFSALRDSSHLVLHQLSMKTALDEIKALIDNRRILVATQRGTPDQQLSITRVDEYADEYNEDHVYHLRDVVDALHLGRQIQDDRHRELLRVAQKPTGADAKHPPIVTGQEIQVGLSTLRTLSQAGALEDVANAFSLYITLRDSEEVLGSLGAINKQQKVWEWHQDLWKAIRNDSRFITVAHFTPPELERDKQQPELDVYIAGFLLARQTGAPLLVDDRMFQLVALNESQGNRCAAFSTDHLLLALHKSNRLTTDQLADDLLQLMKWRYKFIVPPPVVLKHFVDRFTSYPPGKPLQEIAAYVHDCMRDPGLFSGLEPTEPPQIIAFHLFQEWISSIVDFVMNVWADDTYDNQKAEHITKWAMTDFLPALPEAFAPWFRARLAELVKKMVSTRAVLKSVTVRDTKRANIAIQAVASALGVDPGGDEYLQLMAGVVDSVDWTLQGSEETDMLVRSLVLQSIFLHLKTTDARTATVLLNNSFPIEVKPARISEHLVSILDNPDHPDRLDLPPGPMIAYHDNNSDVAGTLTSIGDYLFSPDRRVRRAAHSHFEVLTNAEFEVLSANSKVVIARHKIDLLSDDDVRWRKAAIQISDAISEDFLCNLASVRQALQMQLDHIPFLLKVLRPSVASLSSLQLPLGNPSEELAKITLVIGECARSTSLREACDYYYKHFGHLPLAGCLSLASMVNAWLVLHEEEEQVWSQVWEWADSTQGPLARYHACCVFVLRPDLVPQERLSALWNEILEIVHPSPEGTNHVWTQAWVLRCHLAKHYASHIECNFPGTNSEKIAGASWRLADRVSFVLEAVPELRSFFLDEVSRELHISSAFRNTIHPFVIPSTLRYATLYLPSLWSLSLLCTAAPNLQSLAPSEALAEIGKQIVHGVLDRFPIHPKASNDVIYGFELSLAPAASISSFLAEDSDYRRFLEAFRAAQDTQESKELAEPLLKLIPAQEPKSQYFLAHDLLVRAYTGELPQDTLWEWISENTWVQDVLLDFDANALHILLDALFEVQAQNGGRWATHLPHLFAYACEEAVEGGDRTRFLFGATIKSSIISNTVGAISRLLHGKHRYRLRAEVTYWEEQLGAMQELAPPWVAARIRAVLAILHTG